MLARASHKSWTDITFVSRPPTCSEDFKQIRRTTGLDAEEEIRANDFVVAMLLRLGRLDPAVMTNCRRLFTKLDRDCSGTLTTYDIEALLASAPDTSFIDDHSFETFHHEDVAGRSNLPLAMTKQAQQSASELNVVSDDPEIAAENPIAS